MGNEAPYHNRVVVWTKAAVDGPSMSTVALQHGVEVWVHFYEETFPALVRL